MTTNPPSSGPFAPDFVQPRRPGRLAWVLLAVWACAAAAAGGLAWHWRHQATELSRQLAAERHRLAQQRQPAVAPRPGPPPAYAQSAGEMLSESGDAWLGTLTALERVARVGVTPVSVEISARERSGRVEVEFTDYAELLAYRHELDQGNPQPEWALESAQQAPAGSGRPGKAVLRRILRDE